MNLVIPFDPATMSVPLPGPLAAESRRTAPDTGLAPAAASSRNASGHSNGNSGSHAQPVSETVSKSAAIATSLVIPVKR